MSIEERICVPVFGETASAFRASLSGLGKEFSFVEFRIDSLHTLDLESVQQITTHWTGRSILTCRLSADGGLYKGSLRDRNAVLQRCFSLNSTYVDIELEQIDDPSFVLDGHKDKLLLSYHNFQSTPSFEELAELLTRMQSYSPAVCKIATQVRSEADSQNLYSLLCLHRNSATRLAVIGMGPRGRATRILAPFLGSVASYSEPVGVTAPRTLGQFSAKKMLEIFSSIR